MKLFDVYPLFDISLVKGEGSYVWDDKGIKYLDLYGGHAVISIGHAHPHFHKRITEQLAALPYYSNSVHLKIQEELAEKLGNASGYEDYSLFLCNSGAEANENALKIASFHNQRKTIIAFKGAFHGRTHGAVAVTDNPKIKPPLNSDQHVIFLPFNDSNALKNVFSEQEICAVIIEPIQGVNGIYEATAEFLQAIQNLCNQHNALFIVDEIQCGYGRSGKFFTHQWANVQPDLITTAKGMGNGFPIASVLIHPKIQAHQSMLGTTFGGSPLACAAALSVLEVLENEKLLENVSIQYNYLFEQLKDIAHIKEIRGKGLMLGIEFDLPIKDLRNKLLTVHHIFTGNATNPNTIRLLPSLSIQKKDIDLFIQALKQTFS